MNEKIGRDVLIKPKTPTTASVKSSHKGYVYGEKWKQKVLAVLKNSDRPLNIKDVQVLAEIPNWFTAKDILMDLELRGLLEHFRSGRQMLFRIKRSE